MVDKKENDYQIRRGKLEKELRNFYEYLHPHFKRRFFKKKSETYWRYKELLKHMDALEAYRTWLQEHAKRVEEFLDVTWAISPTEVPFISTIAKKCRDKP